MAEARAALEALDAKTLPREDVVERALALARACLSLAPKDAGAALAAIEAGLSVASADARLVAAKATALLEGGRLDDAEKAIARAVALAPDLAEAHFARGVIRERQGSLEKAHRSYTRTITLDPAHSHARARRAAVARRLGRLEEARADLELHLARAPRDAKEWIALGVVRSELGAHEDALAAMKRALEAAPGDLQARFQSVVAAGRKHDLPLMARLVDELARAAALPTGAEPHVDRRVDWARGLLSLERGSLVEATDLLGRAFRRSLVEGETLPEPEAALLAASLFPTLRKAGKSAEARALFEEALRKGSHGQALLAAYVRSFGRPAARGLRARLVVRSRGQGDPPERLSRSFDVEAETLDEAWDICFEAERVLGGHGLERGAVLDDAKITKEDGPIKAGLIAVFPRAPEEEPSESEAAEPQGFEPEKGWSPDDEGQGGEESGGDEGG
ncbi:tetratricopeptide repeat protein [bacterium]|nr:tetratricopeptide repeat protein [bacterium]